MQKHTLIPFLPFWVLNFSRGLFVIAIIVVTQQMLTDAPAPALTSIWDKWLHIAAWGCMTGIAYLASHSPRTFIICALALVIYSSLVEYLQPIVASRHFSYGDLVANNIGILLALALAPPLNRHLSSLLIK